MESKNTFVEPCPVRLDENSSAAPTYVLQREIGENSTRAPVSGPPLAVVTPMPERTRERPSDAEPA